MNVKGGLIKDREERYMENVTPFGRKLIFTARRGFNNEKREALTLMNVGDEVTVKEIHVYPIGSSVELVEFPNVEFNSTMFEDSI